MPHTVVVSSELGDCDKWLSILPVSNVASASVENYCGLNRYVRRDTLYWCAMLRNPESPTT
ncbi:hypothetical protein BU14_0317s0002 [Porphyra umbilicalis]|uniref:Uncharacterized protein n=1 Tax=Porphyra umbilicalis TaxID=2786 RepID=A0A1X6NZB3_PORUM|nr:hypothetical protein BU14_0317s0002 [Porphyra umbilicalis]|eukprot:OSX73942.1 hypothetical protein BU14_0317s0002 [Porphyra umbilicalis]